MNACTTPQLALVEHLNFLRLDQGVAGLLPPSEYSSVRSDFASHAVRKTGVFSTPHGACDFKITPDAGYVLIGLKLNQKPAAMGLLALMDDKEHVPWRKFLATFQATHKTRKKFKLPAVPSLAFFLSPAYLSTAPADEQKTAIWTAQALAFGIIAFMEANPAATVREWSTAN